VAGDDFPKISRVRTIPKTTPLTRVRCEDNSGSREAASLIREKVIAKIEASRL
jgi:hypothetical protein